MLGSRILARLDGLDVRANGLQIVS
jgi:hypothetical protein